MASETQPIACPSCGGPASVKCTSGGAYFVKCDDQWCGMRTKNCQDNREGAITIWNRRA